MPGKTKGDGKKGRSPKEWISYLKSKGAPQKLIDQIRGIEESGKKYDKSKEYIMRTIIDKIPKKYIEEPTKQHGPGKSGPLAEERKSSVELDNDSYFDVERAVRKIAKENDIDNVESVEISLTATKGLINFKQSETKGCKSKEKKEKEETSED